MLWKICWTFQIFDLWLRKENLESNQQVERNIIHIRNRSCLYNFFYQISLEIFINSYTSDTVVQKSGKHSDQLQMGLLPSMQNAVTHIKPKNFYEFTDIFKNNVETLCLRLFIFFSVGETLRVFLHVFLRHVVRRKIF